MKSPSGDVFLKGQEQAFTYGELMRFLGEHPEYLDHPVRVHDEGNGVWLCVNQLRHDSLEDEMLVLEGSEDVMPREETRRHFVFMSVGETCFYLANSGSRLWTTDPFRKQMMSEGMASDLAGDLKAGCGFE